MSGVSSYAFAGMGLGATLVKVLDELGYESLSFIEAKTVPILLGNRDGPGQVQHCQRGGKHLVWNANYVKLQCGPKSGLQDNCECCC